MPSVSTDYEAPFVATTIDPSGATEATARPKRVLLAGYRLSGGAKAEGVLYQVSDANASEATTNSGRRSQLANMARAFKAANPTTELWCVGVDDPGGGAAGTYTYTFTGTATETGTGYAYANGKEYSFAVTSGDAAADVAAAFKAAVDADLDSPYTAGIASAVVTLTASHAAHMPIVPRAGTQVAGISLATAAGTADTGVGDTTAVTDNLGEKSWDWVVFGFYTDGTTDIVPTVGTALAARWTETVEWDELALFALEGLSHSTITTLTAASAMNSPYTCVLAPHSPTQETGPWEVAAIGAAVDMAQPLQNTPRQWLPLTGVSKSPNDDDFTANQRNLLLKSGAATLKTDASDRVVFDRLVTTYQQNSAGSVDKSYQNVATMKALRYARWDWRRRITTKYPDYLLGDDGAQAQPGVKIMTPNTMRAEATSWFNDMSAIGLFDSSSLDAFVEALTVWRPSGTTVRLDAITQPTFLSPFLQSNHTIAFRL